MIDKHPLPIAGVLALVSVPIHAVLPFWWSHQLAALLLTAIAGVYVGFAVLDGRYSRIAVECVVAICFVAFSTAAMIYNPMWLPAGYIAHGVWDFLHHTPVFKVKMPIWYIPFCAAYDVLAGVGIWIVWWLR